MGAPGSGNRWRYGAKSTTDDCLARCVSMEVRVRRETGIMFCN